MAATGGGQGAAGVVDENVEPPKRLVGLADRALRVLAARQVRLNAEAAPAHALDFGGHAIGRKRLPNSWRAARSMSATATSALERGEPQRVGPPQAARAAR